MYKQIVLEHIVQIPPSLFGLPKEDSAFEILSREYQGIVDSDLGFVVAVCEIVEIGTGKIIHGTGSIYHPVKFTVLTYSPTLHEVIEGEIVELVEFGAFIRLGPNDGLCHLSQITDDKLRFENINSRFIGESGKTLEVEDKVRARIIAVSVGAGRAGKIGLTMRQPFLGRLEWIEDEIEKMHKDKTAETKTDQEPEKETSEKEPAKKKSGKKKKSTRKTKKR